MAEVLHLAKIWGEERDSKSAIGGTASGVAEEGLAVGEVVQWDDGKQRRGKLDEVAGVGVRVAEAEDGVDHVMARVGL
ncbi:Os01g0216350, partial [Oryza sativa Japonica Group]